MKFFKTNKTKFIARGMVLILLLTSVLNLSGCVNRGVEAGFDPSEVLSEKSIVCAYKSDKNKFDINDVTLTVYFGAIEGVHFSSIQLYLEDDAGDIFLLRDIEINDPKDYVIKTKKVFGNLFVKLEFSCKGEIITIPKEILAKSTKLTIWVASEEWDNEIFTGTKRHFFGSVGIDFEKKGDTIIISDWKN